MRDLQARSRGTVALQVTSCAVLMVWLTACGDTTQTVTGNPDADVQATDGGAQGSDADAADTPDVAALELDAAPDEVGNDAPDVLDAPDALDAPDNADSEGAAAVDAPDTLDAPDNADSEGAAAVDAPDTVDTPDAPDVAIAPDLDAQTDAEAPDVADLASAPDTDATVATPDVPTQEIAETVPDAGADDAPAGDAVLATDQADDAASSETGPELDTITAADDADAAVLPDASADAAITDVADLTDEIADADDVALTDATDLADATGGFDVGAPGDVTDAEVSDTADGGDGDANADAADATSPCGGCPAWAPICDVGSGLCLVDVCLPGLAWCDGQIAHQCSADSTVILATTCGSAQTCVAGACVPLVCPPGANFCTGAVVTLCNSDGTDTAAFIDCSVANMACAGGVCQPIVCAAGATQCDPSGVRQTCSADLTSWLATPCAANAICQDGACVPVICQANLVSCQGDTIVACSVDGTQTTVLADCTQTGQHCFNGACNSQVCTPNSAVCTNATYMKCAADGLSWATVTACKSTDACKIPTCNTAGTLCTTIAKACADSDPCTSDTCNGGNCMHTAASGASCQKNSSCSGPGVCQSGACVTSQTVSLLQVVGGSSGNVDGANPSFGNLVAMARHPDGGWVLADAGNKSVRRWKEGVATTLASGFSNPRSVALNDAGVAYVADVGALKILRINPDGTTTAIAGGAKTKGDGVGSHAGFGSTMSALAWHDGYLWQAMTYTVARVSEQGRVDTMMMGGGSSPKIETWANASFAAIYHMNVTKAGDFYLTTRGSNSYSSAVLERLTAAGRAYALQSSLSIYSANASRIGPDGRIYIAGTSSGASYGGNLYVCSHGTVVDPVIGLQCKAWNVLDPSGKVYPVLADFDFDTDGTIWAVAGSRLLHIALSTVDCDDSNPCTADSCLESLGACSHKALEVGAACEDGNPCTAPDACTATGQCESGPSPDCSVGDVCKNDGCDAWTGKCDANNNIAPCTLDGLCDAHFRCMADVCKPTARFIHTIAGLPGDTNNVALTSGRVDGQGSAARFRHLNGLAVGPDGAVYGPDGSNAIMGEADNETVRRVTEDGLVTTWAGGGAGTPNPRGLGTFSYGINMAFDKHGTSYLLARPAAVFPNPWTKLYRTRPGGWMEVWNSSTPGLINGPIGSAKFNFPTGLAIGGGGVLYIGDTSNHVIRSVTPDGTVATFAGTGVAGLVDGPIASAQFNFPEGVAAGINGDLWIHDTGNGKIRHIDANGMVSTLSASVVKMAAPDMLKPVAVQSPRGDMYYEANNTDYYQTLSDGTNIPLGQDASTMFDGTNTQIGPMYSLAFLPDGVGLFSSVTCVRRIDADEVLCDDGNPCTADLCDPQSGTCSHAALDAGAACSDDDVCTVADVCTSGGLCLGASTGKCDDGAICTDDWCNAWTGACSYSPHTGACDDGNVCTVGEQCWNGGCSGGVINRFAGFGDGWLASTDPLQTGAGMQDGPWHVARFSSPTGLCSDASGNVFVADTGNSRIRRISASGDVTTWSGPGAAVTPTGVKWLGCGDDGLHFAASSSTLWSVAPDGTLGFVAAIGTWSSGGVGPIAAMVAAPGGGVVVVSGQGDGTVWQVGASGSVGSLGTIGLTLTGVSWRAGVLYALDSGGRLFKQTPSGWDMLSGGTDTSAGHLGATPSGGFAFVAAKGIMSIGSNDIARSVAVPLATNPVLGPIGVAGFTGTSGFATLPDGRAVFVRQHGVHAVSLGYLVCPEKQYCKNYAGCTAL